MSTLYDQAVAEAKELRTIAETNAKRAIINSLSPRISKMIENQLMRESESVEECGDDDDDVLNDIDGSEDPRSHKKECGEEEDTMKVGEEDRVMLDPKSTKTKVKESTDDDELEVDESVNESLVKILEAVESKMSASDIEIGVYRLCDLATNYVKSSKVVRESKKFDAAINEFISKMGNMYSCVKESTELSESLRTRLLNKLETNFQSVRNLVKESNNMNRKVATKRVSRLADIVGLNEEKLTISVNLPDDVQLGDDAVEVELPGEEEGEGLEADGGEGDEGAEDMGGSEDGDMGDLDLGGEGGADGEEEDPDMEKEGMEGMMDEEENEGVYEGLGFDDSDVIEIDEAMLRREIGKLRGLSEDQRPEAKPGKVPVDDFGGGEDDGDPWLDHDVTTESRKKKAKKESVAAKQDAADEKLAAKKEGRSNRTSTRLSEGEMVAELRQQLTEMNLFNAKLLYTNKLLQVESLTGKQKMRIVEALDDAKTVNEVKLVYKSLSGSMLANNGKSLSESTGARKVLGSSSRPTRTAGAKSDSLNESLDTNRWARLAGIV